MAVATDPRKTGIASVSSQLAHSSVTGLAVTGTVNETTLATVTIPAGVMGISGGIEIRTVWSVTNSANAKTLRVRFGGGAGTAYVSIGVTTSATVSDIHRIRNRGAANSQVSSFASAAGSFTTTGGAIVTSSVDTTAAVDVVITGQLANSGETITLESYEVWLLPG